MCVFRLETAVSNKRRSCVRAGLISERLDFLDVEDKRPPVGVRTAGERLIRGGSVLGPPCVGLVQRARRESEAAAGAATRDAVGRYTYSEAERREEGSDSTRLRHVASCYSISYRHVHKIYNSSSVGYRLRCASVLGHARPRRVVAPRPARRAPRATGGNPLSPRCCFTLYTPLLAHLPGPHLCLNTVDRHDAADGQVTGGDQARAH